MPNQVSNTICYYLQAAVLSVALFNSGHPPAVAEHVQPLPELRLPCRVVEVWDGDTVTVELKMRARVRLLDCWAPELRDAGGKTSRERMRQLAEGQGAILSVPLDRADRLDDVLTFGRILGRVYVKGVDVGGQLVREGLATREKE